MGTVKKFLGCVKLEAGGKFLAWIDLIVFGTLAIGHVFAFIKHQSSTCSFPKIAQFDYCSYGTAGRVAILLLSLLIYGFIIYASKLLLNTIRDGITPENGKQLLPSAIVHYFLFIISFVNIYFSYSFGQFILNCVLFKFVEHLFDVIYSLSEKAEIKPQKTVELNPIQVL